VFRLAGGLGCIHFREVSAMFEGNPYCSRFVSSSGKADSIICWIDFFEEHYLDSLWLSFTLLWKDTEKVCW